MTEAPKKKKIYPAAIAATVFAFVLIPLHAGCVVLLAFFPLVLWMIISIDRAIRHPETRKTHLARIFVWTIAFFTALGAEYAHYVAARNYADGIAIAIRNFSAAHGRYPENLAEIGIDHQEMRGNLGFSGYSRIEDRLSLFYTPTFSYFRPYVYDFKRGAWDWD